MAVIQERPTSRPFTVGPETGDRTLRYWVAGTNDEAEVEALVQSTVPAFYLGLQFQSYKVEPDEDGYSWDVEAKYGLRQRMEPGQWSVSFDFSGATTHITQAKAHVASYSNDTPPDYKGAINVADGKAEGCDIITPQMTFQETHIVADTFITDEYIALLGDIVGTTNASEFRGFDAGEVLCSGVSGSKRSGSDWEITFKFSVSPNAEDLIIGDIAVDEKGGHEYLWVAYKDDTSNDRLVKQPDSVHVERVYDASEFVDLFPWIP